MPGLKDITISGGYKSLVRVDDNNGVGSSAIQCTDGDGNKAPMKMGKNLLQVQPADSDGNALEVNTSGGTNRFRVNTSTPFVTALGNHVNTQYAYFGVTTSDTSGAVAGTHYPLVFGNGGSGMAMGDQANHFGTGTDPATSFTTAAATDQTASELIRYMMYVPDDISVDAVYSIEGADAATGDTTRFHLMSYTFNSGSTSCLTSGTLVAHSDDTTNAGSEQVYKSTWNIDSASVSGGKVLICTFESDSVNSDFAYQAIIKYHLV
tara:strand:- start:1154 stop:1945 length:792 start_codon:yes stop_codon:yes gene_type:complete